MIDSDDVQSKRLGLVMAEDIDAGIPATLIGQFVIDSDDRGYITIPQEVAKYIIDNPIEAAKMVSDPDQLKNINALASELSTVTPSKRPI